VKEVLLMQELRLLVHHLLDSHESLLHRHIHLPHNQFPTIHSTQSKWSKKNNKNRMNKLKGEWIPVMDCDFDAHRDYHVVVIYALLYIINQWMESDDNGSVLPRSSTLRRRRLIAISTNW
jgi:hypothetical protein